MNGTPKSYTQQIIPVGTAVIPPHYPGHSASISRNHIWVNARDLASTRSRKNDKDWKWDGKRRRFVYLRYKDHFKGDRSGMSPMVAVMLMFAITLVLSSILSTWSLSPEIYFHVEESVTTDVTVEIPDGEVTKTIPGVQMGSNASWKDVRIDTDGTVTFDGKQYSFLYYEGRWSYQWSNQGWLVEKEDGRLYLNGEPTSQSNILDFLREEMRESGLCENEIEFLIQRIMDLDMLDMEKPFMSIHYIPIQDVNRAIRLTTSFNFTQMRRHFAFYEHDQPVEMVEPVYEEIGDTGYVIHETAVNKF